MPRARPVIGWSSGETLSEVAERYRAGCRRWRGQRDRQPYHLFAGQLLSGAPSQLRRRPGPRRAIADIVPPPLAKRAVRIVAAQAAARIRSVATLGPVLDRRSPPRRCRPRGRDRPSCLRAEPPPLSGNGFMWPVRGRVASRSATSPTERATPASTSGPEGTAVLAAENGIVVSPAIGSPATARCC